MQRKHQCMHRLQTTLCKDLFFINEIDTFLILGLSCMRMGQFG